VSLSTLQPGSTVTVFPEDQIGDERAQTVLIRVKEELLQMPEDRTSWVPGGYVAYSRVCTHAGCPVGEFQAEQSILLCPCHQSTFDVLRAAAPTGGPAARALPQLPLYVHADGTLRANGEFTAPPGPGFWGIS
jgi:ubiquinol-cytochrome c reductase iron-sulfur subunit